MTRTTEASAAHTHADAHTRLRAAARTTSSTAAHTRARTHTRPHTRARAGAHGHGRWHGRAAAGTTIGRKQSGRRYDGHTGARTASAASTDGGQKSPPLTRHQQAHTRARERTGAGTATRPHRQRAQRARTHGRRDSERSEQAREQPGTLYIDAIRRMYAIYSVK